MHPQARARRNPLVRPRTGNRPAAIGTSITGLCQNRRKASVPQRARPTPQYRNRSTTCDKRPFVRSHQHRQVGQRVIPRWPRNEALFRQGAGEEASFAGPGSALPNPDQGLRCGSGGMRNTSVVSLPRVLGRGAVLSE